MVDKAWKRLFVLLRDRVILEQLAKFTNCVSKKTLSAAARFFRVNKQTLRAETW